MESLQSPTDCKLRLFDGLSGVVEGRLGEVVEGEFVQEGRLGREGGGGREGGCE